MDIISTAKSFAKKAHEGHTYGNEPYFEGHVEKVVNILLEYSESPNLVAGAYLHDVVEDCGVSLEEIEANFGWYVGGYVNLVTDPAGYENRRDRKEALTQKFMSGEPEHTFGAAIIKCCDRIANHAACLNQNSVPKMTMYRNEFPEFMRVFGSEISAEFPQLWHRLFDQYALLIKRVEVYG